MTKTGDVKETKYDMLRNKEVATDNYGTKTTQQKSLVKEHLVVVIKWGLLANVHQGRRESVIRGGSRDGDVFLTVPGRPLIQFLLGLWKVVKKGVSTAARAGKIIKEKNYVYTAAHKQIR